MIKLYLDFFTVLDKSKDFFSNSHIIFMPFLNRLSFFNSVLQMSNDICLTNLIEI
jgi:hypothetical protein